MAVAIVLAFGTAVGLLISRGSNTTTPPVATQRLDAGTASRGRGPETTPIPNDTPQTKKDSKKDGEPSTAPSKNKGTGRDRTKSGSRTRTSGTGRTKTQVTFTDKEATVQPTAAEIKEEPAPPQATRVQMTLNDFATSYATEHANILTKAAAKKGLENVVLHLDKQSNGMYRISSATKGFPYNAIVHAPSTEADRLVVTVKIQ
jgi:hypothetical protein